MTSDILLIGWQADDLPSFGRVDHIVVFQDRVMFLVLVHFTIGIERHFHSYVIRRTSESAAFWYSDLADKMPYRAHLLQNGRLYITVRSHIENTSNS